MAVKVTKPQVNVREEVSKLAGLGSLAYQDSDYLSVGGLIVKEDSDADSILKWPFEINLNSSAEWSGSYNLSNSGNHGPIAMYLNNDDTSITESEVSLLMSAGGSGSAQHQLTVKRTGTNTGDLIFLRRTSGGASDESLRITTNGNIIQGNDGVHSWTAINNTLFTAGGIGVTSNSDWGLQMAGSNAERIRFFTSNGGSGAQVGSITVTASATAYNTSSDYRLKTDLQSMTGSIDRVKALNPINFAWVADGERTDGFLAHEAAEVVPEAVTGVKDEMRSEEYEVTPAVLDDDGKVTTEAVMGTREVPNYQGIDQSKLVPLLTSALQEAIDKIESLEQRLNDAGL